MSKTQTDAQQIADALHAVESALADSAKAMKTARKALKLHHGLLEQAATTHCETVGIDVAPLSAGGDKPR